MSKLYISNTASVESVSIVEDTSSFTRTGSYSNPGVRAFCPKYNESNELQYIVVAGTGGSPSLRNVGNLESRETINTSPTSSQTLVNDGSNYFYQYDNSGTSYRINSDFDSVTSGVNAIGSVYYASQRNQNSSNQWIYLACNDNIINAVRNNITPENDDSFFRILSFQPFAIATASYPESIII